MVLADIGTGEAFSSRDRVTRSSRLRVAKRAALGPLGTSARLWMNLQSSWNLPQVERRRSAAIYLHAGAFMLRFVGNTELAVMVRPVWTDRGPRAGPVRLTIG